MPPSEPAPTSDLRRRRRTRAKLSVQTEALRLFEANGYQQTSVDEITHAAAISPRTFFRYFQCKEDVVLWDEYDDLSPQELWHISPSGDPVDHLIRRVRDMTAEAYRSDPQRLLARARLSYTVPEIRARFVNRQLSLIGRYFAELSDSFGVRRDDLSLAITFATVFAAFLVALERWQRHNGREDLLTLVDDALAALADSASHLPPRMG